MAEQPGDAVRQRLAEISARAEAATPGPWVSRDLSGDGFSSGNGAGWWWVWQESKLPYYGGVMEMDRALDKEGEFSRPGFLGDTTITDHRDGDTERSDAEFVAAARSDVPRLVAALTAVLDLTAKYRHGALRWADPLPVPEWVDRVEAAIAVELSREDTP